jgi:hypothetical protein
VPTEPEPDRYTTRWVVLLPNAPRLRQSTGVNAQAHAVVATTQPATRPESHRSGLLLVHRGDWHKVTKTAIRFLRQAQRAGIAPTCWDGGHRDLAVNKLTDELDGLKKVAAKLVHFDGAYLRFTGELRIEHQHTG